MQVDADGNMRDMPDDYPKFEEKGADNVVTLRLPRFSEYVLYDPTIEVGYETDGGLRSQEVPAMIICASVFGVICTSIYVY